jgi:hypothetical protein
MEPFLTMMVVFLSSTSLIKNPYLRAKFVEVSEISDVLSHLIHYQNTIDDAITAEDDVS